MPLAELHPETVYIVLSTYNGEAFLEEQISSIRRQRWENWRLLARDDGSDDGSLDILRRAATADPRIGILDAEGNVGPLRSFEFLLQEACSSAPRWILLCDQDDVWLPDKIGTMLEVARSGTGAAPALVHSDLAVVDEELRIAAPSFMRHAGLDPQVEAPFSYLLTRNFVTGAATMIDRRVVEQALPFPESAIMHDWWLALVAAACGDIAYADRQLVQYRQHDANAIGARGLYAGLNPFTNWIRGWRRGNAEYFATLEQALEIARRVLAGHVESTDPLVRTACEAFLSLAEEAQPVARILQARRIPLRGGDHLLQWIFLVRLASLGFARRNSPKEV